MHEGLSERGCVKEVSLPAALMLFSPNRTLHCIMSVACAPLQTCMHGSHHSSHKLMEVLKEILALRLAY